MDDDTIPTQSALEELILAKEALQSENISFLCSKVIGLNGEEMNLPTISRRTDETNYPIWMKHLDKSIIEVEDATFVSLLINVDAINKLGLPWKEFFIWGDDTEYTMRLTSMYGPAYVVGKSIVVHKRFGPSNLSIVDETNVNRIAMYRYQFRNGLINASEYFGNKIVFKSGEKAGSTKIDFITTEKGLAKDSVIVNVYDYKIYSGSAGSNTNISKIDLT